MASSSSGVGKVSKGHQVFINFKEKELFNGFVVHLYAAFKEANIKCLVKHEQVGTTLQDMLVRIEESRIALVIFSKDYTTSDWCLDELVKIKECIEKDTLIGIPIFYKLEISVVENQEGDFGDKFRNLKRNNRQDLVRTNKWEEALTLIAKIRGIELLETSDKTDKEFIELIVNKVKSKVDIIEMQENEDQKRQDRCSTKSEITHSDNPKICTESSTEKPPKNCSSEMVAASAQAGDSRSQVFINYRREEPCQYFIKRLLYHLERKTINYFTIENMEKGKPFSYRFKKIEESAIALAIFSKRYTKSRWCLKELVKMKELEEAGELMVIPVYVDVTRTEVQKFDGEFGEGFKKMIERYAIKPEKVQKWKEAVRYITRINGLEWKDGPQYSFKDRASFSAEVFASNTASEVRKELLRRDPNFGKKKDDHNNDEAILQNIVSLVVAIFCGYKGPRIVFTDGDLCTVVSWLVGILVYFMTIKILQMISPPVTTIPTPPKLDEEKSSTEIKEK